MKNGTACILARVGKVYMRKNELGRFKMLVLSVCLAFLSPALPAQVDKPQRLLKEGKERLDKKDYKGAITDFSISLEMEPSVEGYYLRATAKYLLNDDLQGALADYDNAISLDPYNPILYNSRGNVKDELKKTTDAIADFNKSIALDSTYTNAYYNRGIAHYNVQEYKEAQADFEYILKKTPQDAEAMIGIGLCFVKLAKTAEACVWFTKARQHQPALAEEYLNKLCK